MLLASGAFFCVYLGSREFPLPNLYNRGLDPSYQKSYIVLCRCTLMVERVAQAVLSFFCPVSWTVAEYYSGSLKYGEEYGKAGSPLGKLG